MRTLQALRVRRCTAQESQILHLAALISLIYPDNNLYPFFKKLNRGGSTVPVTPSLNPGQQIEVGQWGAGQCRGREAGCRDWSQTA